MPVSTKKIAAIGGDGQDSNFEQSFSSLAHAYNHESAPSLEQHELGFQMLERSDDGERAAGITGFQVGDQLIYAPVFWLVGRIKGHELLYLHNHDLFIPNKENWINEMMQKRSPRVGESVTRNPRRLGIRQPDLQRMTRSPYKFSSLQGPSWARTAAARLAEIATERLKPESSSLLDFIKEAGQEGVLAFKKLADHSPEIAAAAHNFHGDALLDALSAASKARVEKKAAIKSLKTDPRPGLRIISVRMSVSGNEPVDLSDLDKEKLMRDGSLIHDKRPDAEVSKAYREDTAVRLFNPDTAGVYDVITAKGDVEKCLVLPKPWSTHGRMDYTLVVSLGDVKRVSQSAYNKVWATEARPHSEFVDAIDKLVTADSLDGSEQSKLVIVSTTGVCSVPLRIGLAVWSGDGIVTYGIDGQESRDHLGDSRIKDVDYCCDKKLVVDNTDTTRFRTLDNKLYVPNSAKVLRVSSSYDDQLELGDASDLKSAIGRSMSKLAVYRSGNEVVISTAAGQSHSMSPYEGLAQLVMHHGLRESAARDLLKQADSRRKVSCLVKYAEPYMRDVDQYGPAADLDDTEGAWTMNSGESVAERQNQQMHSRVDMPEEERRQAEPVHYVDDGLEIAQQASQSGQKDVFDASTLTTMLRNMRDDQLIDRFIPALTRAMDASGRLLFQFYWHQEDFSERYGERDLPEMEDAIRNMFEGLGDLVLKLKQKSVHPELGDDELGVSLNDLAGAS